MRGIEFFYFARFRKERGEGGGEKETKEWVDAHGEKKGREPRVEPRRGMPRKRGRKKKKDKNNGASPVDHKL